MAETNVKADTVSHFTFEPLIGGDAFPLSDYSGQVIMIVNTASNCGFTKQYEGLERLYQTYKERGFVIIGVHALHSTGHNSKKVSRIEVKHKSSLLP